MPERTYILGNSATWARFVQNYSLNEWRLLVNNWGDHRDWYEYVRRLRNMAPSEKMSKALDMGYLATLRRYTTNNRTMMRDYMLLCLPAESLDLALEALSVYVKE